MSLELIFDKDCILKRDFYERDTAETAKDLLGKIIATKNQNKYSFCFIAEVEAYYGAGDPASHAYRGPTLRSKIMFGRPAVAYVYFCYGNHFLFNCVTEKEKIPGAVLIRACEPFAGIEIMKERRGIDSIINLANGPGKLTKALGIDLAFNGADLTKINSPVFIIDGSVIYKKGYFDFSESHAEYLNLSIENIAVSSRIGIKNGAEKPLRFYIKNSKYLSVKDKKQ